MISSWAMAATTCSTELSAPIPSGGSGDDVLRNGDGADRLAGEGGNDHSVTSGSRLNLGGGDDTISGSANKIDAVLIFDFERLLV